MILMPLPDCNTCMVKPGVALPLNAECQARKFQLAFLKIWV